MERHVKILGWLWIAYSILGVVGATAAAGVLIAIGAEEQASAEFGWVAILSVPGIAGGTGLLKRQRWARILLIVFGFVNLFAFPPIGTALGIYSFWVLLRRETGQLFAPGSMSRRPG